MDNLKPLQKTLALAKENIAEAQAKQAAHYARTTYMEPRRLMRRKARPLSMTLKAKFLLLTLKARPLLRTKARAS